MTHLEIVEQAFAWWNDPRNPSRFICHSFYPEDHPIDDRSPEGRQRSRLVLRVSQHNIPGSWAVEDFLYPGVSPKFLTEAKVKSVRDFRLKIWKDLHSYAKELDNETN